MIIDVLYPFLSADATDGCLNLESWDFMCTLGMKWVNFFVYIVLYVDPVGWHTTRSIIDCLP